MARALRRAGALLVGSILLFFQKREQCIGSLEAMMLVSSIGGLHAKSALEMPKNAFKIVFRDCASDA